MNLTGKEIEFIIHIGPLKKEVKKWTGFRLLSLRFEGPHGSCGGLG
jgi:hypothetical protein